MVRQRAHAALGGAAPRGQLGQGGRARADGREEIEIDRRLQRGGPLVAGEGVEDAIQREVGRIHESLAYTPRRNDARPRYDVRCARSSRKNAFSSGSGTAPAKAAKRPAEAIVRAARMNAPQATRASELPTLMGRTPSAARSPTVMPLAVDTSTLTGFGATAATAAAISSRHPSPRPERQSAPAAAVAPTPRG